MSRVQHRLNRLLAASALLAATLMLRATAATPTNATLVVHEWGTFTSFQDSDGATIPGINVDDEPVPSFVHRLNGLQIFTAGSYPGAWSQGAPSCHADVTLRLETPVLYFYPRSGFRSDQPIDVEAKFPAGWLTEFFPFAASEVPGFPGNLDAAVQGTLSWRGLKLSREPAANLPQTSARVWLAPRKVQAAVVTSANGEEAEKYLFYRGVAHLDAPLVVRQRDDELMVALRDGVTLTSLPPSWLVRVLPDGRVWYRTLRADAARDGKVVVALPRDAAAATPRGLDALRTELADALVAQGLFADEAQAMLETWQLSYFASEGVRLFFLLPQSWTNRHLPVSISVPAELTRVMMGRIELVSAHQRAVLARLYAMPAETFEQVPIYARLMNDSASLSTADQVQRQRKVMELLQNFDRSHAEFYRDLGLQVPEELRLYDSLGRFRDALLGHEWRSAQDEATRQRLTQIIGTFSACIPPGLQ